MPVILSAIAANGTFVLLGVVVLVIGWAQLTRRDNEAVKAIAMAMLALAVLGLVLFIIAIPYIGTGGG